MSHYKPYPAYKDSGVEWLGKVPEHWSINQMKSGITSLQNGVWGDEPNGDADDVPCARVADFDRVRLVVEEPLPTIRSIPIAQRTSKRVSSGDLLLEKSGGGEQTTVGAMVQYIGGSDVVCSNFVAVVKCKPDISARWLCYANSHLYNLGVNTRSIKQTTGIQNLDSNQYSSELIAFPTFSEQQLIAAHLDRETARIDALVEKKTRFMELLREKRQALITHAVTKGLDPNVKMKDSGVEWLGEVPEGWEIKSVRHVLAAIGDVDHFMPESVDNGVPYLMTGDLKGFLSNVSLQDCKQVSHGDYFRLSRRIKSSKGDIVMARYATIGTLMYVDVDVDFLVSYSCVTLKPDLSKMSGLYLFHYMKSTAFHEGIKNQINTNTQDNVGIKDLQSVKIAVPPIEEQAAIAAFLDFETTKLDALKNKIERSIELLKERRSALITAAVTGQIDLREAA